MPSKPKRPANLTTRTLRLRVKDRHASWLSGQARWVNFVWNFCNELSAKALEREGRFLSAFDLQKYTDGAGKEGLPLHSHTVQQVGAEFVTRRRQFKKPKLRWRTSRGARRSLGWVPFKVGSLKYKGGQVRFNGQLLSLWDSYGLAGYTLRSGSFTEDSRGRWYLNVCVEVEKKPSAAGGDALGIDLGLKDLVVASDGMKVEAQQFYRDLELALAVAQRAGKKARVRAIHAKIANRRKDQLHKLSTALVRQHSAIFVGNVNASALAKTGAAKSVLDAGWSTFRTMLQYKCEDAGVWFKEVDERYSTQDCHVCGSRAGPKGLAGLSVRSWRCSCCGTEHDRDTNAAQVIKARGLVMLEREFSDAAEARADEAVSNEAGATAPAGAGHGPLVEGILVL